MRYRTEDLLTLLDREPVDAEVRERLLSDAAARAELERLRRVRNDLAGLPELAPPPMAWARVEAAVAARRAPPRRKSIRGSRYAGTAERTARTARRSGRVRAAAAAVAVAAVAAAAVLAGLSALVTPGNEGPDAAATVLADGARDAAREGPSLGTGGASRDTDAGASYRPFVEQSIELERLLARAPEPHAVMTLGTAGTIAGLEEQIAFVDAQLASGAAESPEPRYREALWSERVDLMAALVQVRYAQSAGY